MNTLKEQLTHYKNEHRAMPSFNIDSFEIFQAVEHAVKETSLPCLVQLSANEDKFIEAEKLFLLVKKAQLEGLPIYLNMDHGKDLPRLSKLVQLGFDMVHFDGSALPYQENLSAATSFIKTLKSTHPNILVEVEFNHINLLEDGVDPKSFTDPSQAVEFMQTSGADLLAASIGNLHGASTTLPENVDLDLLKTITSLLPDKFFTLHGGSGISTEQVAAAIDLGIVKININTDLRQQFKRSLKSAMDTINSEKLYDYFYPVIDAVKLVATNKLIQFSQ
ncbi:class II fructose-bisphosphate aldolase [Candidatus Shapirobacteria bacterium]|nr:class II fructose-bisphosphate aldolase [Candidatus Shapirobacteria bacterium]